MEKGIFMPASKKIEKKKIEYLEVNNKSYANRIQMQIDKIEREKKLYDIDKIEKELAIFKKIIKQYPIIWSEIKNELANQEIGGIYG